MPAQNLTTDGDGRPVRPALTRDFIVRTALALLDRDGITGLSMRKLAAELGVNPMAFYHHLPNKEALFDAVVDATYAEIDVDLEALTSWREILAAFAGSLRDVLLRHPHVLTIVATRPPSSPSVLAFADRAMGALAGDGFTDRDLLVMVGALRAFTVGQVLAEIGEPVGGPAEGAGMLSAYPNLARGISGGYRPQEQFDQVVAAMLDGFAKWT